MGPQKQTFGDREGRGEGNREEKGVQGGGPKGRQVSTEQEMARGGRWGGRGHRVGQAPVTVTLASPPN